MNILVPILDHFGSPMLQNGAVGDPMGALGGTWGTKMLQKVGLGGPLGTLGAPLGAPGGSEG